MRISALTLHGDHGWLNLELNPTAPGLTCCYGPSSSGKSTLADFIGHVLYGKSPARRSAFGPASTVPEGEAIVEDGTGHYRLRRYHDGTTNGRLTVASLDLTPVDEHTVAKMLGGISSDVLARRFAISFDQSYATDKVFVEDFMRDLGIFERRAPETSRRTMELAARRDALAQELESRIAAERRMSCDLDAQSRVLDRVIRDEALETAALEQRLRAVEAALAETDARLRYRRLELNTELRWNATEADDLEPEFAELDAEIARWRSTLAELANREAVVRAKLAQIQPGAAANLTTITDQRAWLAVARQLTADLEGEVARLARATASDECVCRDSHPRLRPIVETAQRQLDVLESLVHEQDRAVRAAALQQEAGHLKRSQAELRRQLDHLLDRREELTRAAKPSRRVIGSDLSADCGHSSPIRFSAADAEQLEQRRLELEQERFELAGRLRTRQRQLRDLRAQRVEADRERAALLSARSIEHVQRELADVQRRLERSAGGNVESLAGRVGVEGIRRAADFLAQLTDGRFVRLEVADHGRCLRVINSSGATLDASSLTASERDQIQLSCSFALASVAAGHGVQLPLVFDEPFARFDAGGTAALAAVLDHFSRQGHQVLVFTGRRDAAERLASLGTPVRDILSLRRRLHDLPPTVVTPEAVSQLSATRTQEVGRPTTRRKSKTRKDRAAKSGRSDAA